MVCPQKSQGLLGTGRGGEGGMEVGEVGDYIPIATRSETKMTEGAVNTQFSCLLSKGDACMRNGRAGYIGCRFVQPASPSNRNSRTSAGWKLNMKSSKTF